jgi:regulator of ribonuclease activity A
MDFLTADLMDADEGKLQSCTIQFRHYGQRLRFHGPIRTIKTFEDNPIVRNTLATPGDGAVLVIDGGGSLRSALVGGNLGELGVKNGWAGIVVWGAIRDSVEIDNLQIGVKALGTNPRRSARTGSGQVDIPIVFGDVTFTPGSWLYSDEDGIVVSPTKL